MCIGCWQRHGSPKIVSPAVVMACGLVSRVYDHDGVGGNLHVQLDDWNIEDEFWDEFEVYRDDSSTEQIKVEEECFLAFKALNVSERASALALSDGFFDMQDVALR